MKRILCLLLCLLMLFCIGCQKESGDAPYNDTVPKTRVDSLYTSAGNTYNTHVRMTVATQEMAAPLTTLNIEIKNDTDYFILITDDPTEHPWQRWADGKWISIVEHHLGETIDKTEEDYLWCQIPPHASSTRTDDFSKQPLDTGVYRLQLRYNLTQNNVEPPRWTEWSIDQTPCLVEVYVTVAPSLD